ncbi:MAG: TrmB family transcriptional regulator [Halobacteriota archaeon]
MATLKDLGLSDYESRVYRSLLGMGSATAKELSLVSDVPMGRVYDVLGSLEKHSLVRSQESSRPKKYVAVEPETALQRLVEDKRQELNEEIQRYESIADDLRQRLESSEPVEERFWTAAVGAQESVDLLLERVDSARNNVSIVVGDLSPQLDPDRVGDTVLDHLLDAVDEHVEVSMLVSPDVVTKLGPDVQNRYAEVIAENEEFDVRTQEELHGTFNVIDDMEICVEVTNPLAPDQVLAMIDLKDPEFAAKVAEEFEERWSEATGL